MVACEMCGKDASNGSNSVIAGTQMRVCSLCSKHGSSVEKQEDVSKTFYRKKKEDKLEFELIDNYASKINSEISKKGLNTHQLARAVNIKESSLNKYLSNKIKMDVLTAKKIEKFLEIVLTKQVESVNVGDYMEEEEEEPASLGDLLLKQLREKNNK